MLGRPRSVERKVAKHLTDISTILGYSPVYRIPTIGRTGPDITTNELGLVIDVKSRLEVPHGIITSAITQQGNYFTCPLDQLLEIRMPEIFGHFHSKIVDGYFDHMDEWTKKFMPKSITALVLHRPKMPIGKAMLIISINKAEELCHKIQSGYTSPVTIKP